MSSKSIKFTFVKPAETLNFKGIFLWCNMFVKHFHLLKRTSSLAPEKITVNPPADTYLWSLCVCGVCQWHWTLHVVLMTAGNTLDWASSVEEACYSSQGESSSISGLEEGSWAGVVLWAAGYAWYVLRAGVRSLGPKPPTNTARKEPHKFPYSFMARWKKLPDLGHSQCRICQMEKQEHKEVLVY